MNERLSNEQISQHIHSYLEKLRLTLKQKADILIQLAQKYQPRVHLATSRHFQQLCTEEDSLEFSRLQCTPPKPEVAPTHSQLEVLSCQTFNTQSPAELDHHRLSSQLKGISKVPNRSKEEHRRKKQKVKELLQKTNQCLTVVLDILHRAFSHLVCLRFGKSKKFQTEGIYLRSLKGSLEEHQQKRKAAKSTQQLIELSIQLCDFLTEKVPSFEKKFIDPSWEISLPPPFRLFQSLIP